MAWPDDVGEALGPPRRDEPANLHDDITDELSDHLDCAMRRELLATGDEDEARRNVLQRFGDPKRIASRLWFDAMKEKIVKDRIMIGVAIVLAASCVALCLTLWSSLAQGRRDNAAILADLAQLKKLSQDNEWPRTRPAYTSTVPFGQKSSRVYVTGAVPRPGTYALPIDDSMTIARLLTVTGCDLQQDLHVSITRRISPSEEKTFLVSSSSWKPAPGKQRVTLLRPNDMVNVAKTDHVSDDNNGGS